MKKGATRHNLAAPILNRCENRNIGQITWPTPFHLVVWPNQRQRELATTLLLLVLGRREERCQGIGRGVSRVADIGQAKSGFNSLQQRIVGLKARVPNTTHAVVRNRNEHHFIVEVGRSVAVRAWQQRSEEHTSELQSRRDLVCRLLLE